MIFAFEMLSFIHVGEGGNSYLYLRRKLNWDIMDYTTFTITVGVVGMAAQYTAIPILSEKLKLQDSTIIMLDFGGCFIQMIIMALATTTWMVYLAAFVAFLETTSYTMIRCMISKNVEPDEVGKVLSFVGAFQAFVPIISAPIFGMIYRNTLEIMPETYLIVLACLWFIDFSIVVYIDRGLRRIRNLDASKKREVEMEKAEDSKNTDEGGNNNNNKNNNNKNDTNDNPHARSSTNKRKSSFIEGQSNMAFA